MRLCNTCLSTSILLYGFLHNAACIAMPQPARDGAGEDKAPLPGRSDYSANQGGRLQGFIGDDKLPKHMTHLQDSIAEFPGNGEAHPYDRHGDMTRTERFRGIPAAKPELGSGEPQVLDEKTWASQKNPNWITDTTIRPLPYYESGGKEAKISDLEQKRRNEEIKKHPEWDGEWPSKQLPEGAYKSKHGPNQKSVIIDMI